MAPALLLLLLATPQFGAASPPPLNGPPVRVWLESGPSLAPGEQTRVYLQTSADGNLVVLHARTDGRIEILFPADPAGDPFVRAGTYEIRGPDEGQPFAASEPEGWGMVVAALSPDPIWFDEFVRYGKWNVDAVSTAGSGADREALLTDIVQRMLGDGSFNYDVATYTIAPRAAAMANAAPYAPEPAGGCIDCDYAPGYFYLPGYFYAPGYYIGSGFLPRRHFAHHHVDVFKGGIPPLRHFPQQQLRIPAAGPAHWFPPDPPAIAAYAAGRPVAVPEPLRTPPPRVAGRPPRPWPAEAMAPRRRIPDASVTASPSPTTFATRAVPLVTRDRSPAARAAVPSRSVLLTRVVHVARSASPALMPVTAPASSGFVAVSERLLGTPAARPSTTGGLIATPSGTPAPLAGPEPRSAAPPGVASGAAQAWTPAAAPAAPGRAGSPTGVPLGVVRTGGWRH